MAESKIQTSIIQYLEKEGLLATHWNQRRAIEVKDDRIVSEAVNEDSLQIPLLGMVAAGNPIEAIENPHNLITVPKFFIKGAHKYFALTVKGDSMIDVAICDGDYVVIRSQKTAEKGEIVAAMIDGEATVKTWSKKDGHFWLLPANDDFTPIPADDAQILGKVTAVLRAV